MPGQSQQQQQETPTGINTDAAVHDAGLSAGDDGQRPLDILLNAIANSSGYDLGSTQRYRPEHDGETSLGGQISNGREGSASRQAEDQINLAELLSSQPDLQTNLISAGAHTPVWDQYAVQQAIRGYLSSRRRRGQPEQRAVGDDQAEAGGSAASSVQLWHPMTAQKSYGRERRILNPAPLLRATGPVASVVTSFTLSTVKEPGPSPTDEEPTRLSSHTQHIPYTETDGIHPDIDASFPRDAEASRDPYFQRLQTSYQSHGQYGQAAVGRSAKQLRDEDRRKMREIALRNGFGASLPRFRKFNLSKEREALADGITFPGLYVGQEVGKSKNFHLELGVSVAGASAPAHASGSTEMGVSAEPSRADGVPLPQVGEQASPSTLDTMGYSSESKPAADDPVPAASTGAPSPVYWAKLLSGPLSIVSKPSQKTAKARTMTTCFTVDASFSLCVRINSQTVRTKYMKLDADASGSSGSTPHLSARSGKWTPFHFEMVRRAPIPKEEIRNVRGRYRNVTEERDTVLRYGSIVRLVDEQSGIRSEPVRLVRVDKNEVLVGEDTGHPVSELHRIGLVRVNNTARRMYLSAPSARIGGAELLQVDTTPVLSAQPSPVASFNPEKVEHSGEPATLGAAPSSELLPQAEVPGQPGQGAEGDTSDVMEPPTKKRRTKRHALVAAIAEEEQEGSQLAMLQWASATSFVADREFKGGKKSTVVRQVTVDRVEDWMCWIIGSVGHTTYSFFSVDPVRPLPTDTAIDSAPYLLDTAKYNIEDHSLDLVLPDQAFFSSAAELSRGQPADMYLGTMGPLHATYWRSTATPNKVPVEGTAPGAESVSDHGAPCVPYDIHQLSDTRGRQANSAYPAGPGHVIVKLELPPLQVIQAAINAHAQTPSAATEDPRALGTDQTHANDSQGLDGGDALDSLADSNGAADSHVDDLARALLAVQDEGNDIPGFMNTDQSLAHGPIDPALSAMDEAAVSGPPQPAAPSDDSAFAEADITGQSNDLAVEPSGSFEDNKPDAESQIVPSQAQFLDRDVRVILPATGGQSRSTSQKGLPIILVRGADGMCFDLDVAITIEVDDGQPRVEVSRSA